MKRFLINIFILFFSITYCFGQANPNAVKDSNLRSLPGSISSKLEAMKTSLDNEMQTLKENMPVPPNPFDIKIDSANIFDSLHGKLTVFVKNINKISGTINVAIFNNHASFVNAGPVFRGAILPITASNMVVIFDSIPKGAYSVAVFHDEDKNGVLNKNQMNIPLEGYGFSNNIVGNFGPPNYAQTKFTYSGKNKAITINIAYFKFPK